MKRLLQVYGIETTEIPEGGVYGGPPIRRSASEGSYRPETSAPHTASSSSRHSWPSNRAPRSQRFIAALNPLQVQSAGFRTGYFVGGGVGNVGGGMGNKLEA